MMGGMTPPLSRRSFLLGTGGVAGAAFVGATGLVGCANPATQLTLPTPDAVGSVRERLETMMTTAASNTDLLGLSVRDLRTGATYGYRGDFDTQSASIAKVMIVLLALRKARAEGTELTFEQYGLASKAIINSDNDSADALWEWVGGRPAYTALASELGLPNTHADDRSEFWSWTNTTPDDQRSLMDALVDGTRVIDVDDRLYLLDLMSKTNSEQTWGIGHDRGTHVHVQMKNGWVQFRSLDNLWAVNSIGHVVGEGRDYTAAIMTRMSTFDEGRTLVDAIGASLFQILDANLI